MYVPTTYLSSSLPSEHKVNTRCRHSALFFALASAYPQVMYVCYYKCTFMTGNVFVTLSLTERQVMCVCYTKSSRQTGNVCVLH